MVEDRASKRYNDFSASPLPRSTLTGGYALSAFITGMIMCLLALLLAEIYIVLYGGELLSLLTTLKVIGILLLSVASSGSMVFLLVSFFKSTNAFATGSTIIGTLVGFLTGIYIPIGNLPQSVQMLIKLFPLSHAGALMRQVMMNAPMQDVFAGTPADVVTNFEQTLGVTYRLGDLAIQPWMSILYLVVTTIVCFILATLMVSRKRAQ
jgi:multidrug/hemolysin transport system permease protein